MTYVGFTESLNGLRLKGSSGSLWFNLLEYGHLELSIQDHVQMNFRHVQGVRTPQHHWTICASTQALSTEMVLLDIWILLCSCLFHCFLSWFYVYHWQDTDSALSAPSLQTLTDIDMIVRTSISPGWKDQSLDLSPKESCSHPLILPSW